MNNNETSRLRMPQIFVGKNYNKIINHSFSFSGFFFGGIYFLYRKMYLYGIILYLLTTLITLLLPNYIENPIIIGLIYLVFSVVIGITTNKIYKKFVASKLNKIRAKNLSYEASATMCRKQGGTNLPLAIIISIVIGGISSILLGLFIDNSINEPSESENNGININENNNSGITDESKNSNTDLLMSYVGTYKNDNNTIKISLGIDELTVEVQGNDWESIDTEVNADGTITYEDTFLSDTTKLDIVKTATGISVTYSTTDEDNIDNTISGEYQKVYYTTKGWTGVYENENTTVILNEFEDGLSLYLTKEDDNSISSLDATIETYDTTTASDNSDFLGDTIDIVVNKVGDAITITASSTDEDSIYNNINGTYTKSS